MVNTNIPENQFQGSNTDPLNQEALFWHRIVFLQEFLAESCQSRLDVLLPKLQEVTLCLSDLISFSGKVRINILSLWCITVATELSGKSRWLTVIKSCYFGLKIIILRDQFTAESCWESVAECSSCSLLFSRTSRPLARCLLVRRPALLLLKPFTHWRSTTASSHRSHTAETNPHLPQISLITPQIRELGLKPLAWTCYNGVKLWKRPYCNCSVNSSSLKWKAFLWA